MADDRKRFMRAIDGALESMMEDGTYLAILDQWGIASRAVSEPEILTSRDIPNQHRWPPSSSPLRHRHRSRRFLPRRISTTSCHALANNASRTSLAPGIRHRAPVPAQSAYAPRSRGQPFAATCAQADFPPRPARRHQTGGGRGLCAGDRGCTDGADLQVVLTVEANYITIVVGSEPAANCRLRRTRSPGPS